MVVYIASKQELPLLPWLDDSPAFNVEALTAETECVRTHFTLPHVRYAGSHTSCGCGFNEGREYEDLERGDPKSRRAALESTAQLVRYIKAHRIEEIYSCWSMDEPLPRESERQMAAEDLLADAFIFAERELIRIDHGLD